MRKILLTMFVLVFLIGCAPKSELDAALAEISNLESKIVEQEEEINNLKSDLLEGGELLDSLQSDYETLENDYENLDDSYEELSEDKESLVSELVSISGKYSKAKTQLGDLICDKQITNMKYENIFDVSTILSGWWARQSGVLSVRGTYRDHIWSNADTKIHGIRFVSSQDNKEYVEHF